MKRNKLLLILAIVVVLTLVLAGCKGDCTHEEYGAWQITKAPTADATGEAIRVCTSCGVAETAMVAKLSDTSVWTATSTTATHASAGKIVYTSTYGSVEVYVDRLTAHVYDKEVAADQYLVSAADCTHAATYRKSCSCGAVSTATFTSGSPAGHKATAHAAKEAVHTATALANGNSAYWSCDVCGKVFSDAACATETTLEAVTIVASHTFDAVVVTKEAACVTTGSATQTCTACGREETIVLAATGHDFSKGLMAPVKTTSDYWDIEEGEIWTQEETDTDHHGPLCTVCGYVDKDHKAAHVYGDDILVVEEDLYSYYIVQIQPCTDCNHIKRFDGSQGEGDYRGYLLNNGWKMGETVDPTYAVDGYIPFTKGDITAKYAISRIVAPYENKTFHSIRLEKKEKVDAGATAYTTAWDTATLVVGDMGIGVGNAYPFRGDVTISVTDMTTCAVDIKLVDGGSESHLLGYVDPLTGIIVVQSSSDGYDKPTVISPYDVSSANFTSSYCPDAMFITYSLDCGLFDGHTISMMVLNGRVYFGVSFVDASGNAVAAENCYNQTKLVVKDAKNNEIATFLSNGTYVEEADGYQGTYTGAIGDLVVNGLGGFTVAGSSGIYTVVEDADYTADAYVVVGGKKVAYYKATLTGSSYTLVAQSIQVTLHGGAHSSTNTTATMWINCVPMLNELESDSEDFSFSGWYTADGTEGNWGEWVNEDFEVKATLTDLYARWVDKVNLNVVDPMSDVTTISVAANTTIVSKLPEHTGDGILDVDNNRYFAGWFLDSAFTKPLSDDVRPTVEDEGATIYAKWAEAGTWAVVSDGPYPFEYNEDKTAWRSTNWHVTGSTGVHSHSIMEIRANGGPIFVSFSYWVTGEQGWDYLIVHYTDPNPNATALLSFNTKGTDILEANAVAKYFEIREGGVIRFDYDKDNSGNGDAGEEDRAFIVGLTINGRSVTTLGIVDLMEGTYTCAGQDNLVLDGHGAFTWGDKTGTYAKNGAIVDLYVVEEDTNVEYYEITLDGNTYTSNKPTYTVSYVLPQATQGTMESSVMNKNIKFTVPAGKEIAGFVFRDWYTDAAFNYPASTNIYSPSENVTLYAKYDRAIIITLVHGNGAANGSLTTHFANDSIAASDLPAGVDISGFVFRGWYTDDELKNAVTTLNPISDMTIYAKYDPAITITLVYGGTTPNASVTKYFANDVVNIELPLERNSDNQVAVGWYTTATFDEGTEWTSGVKMTEDATLYCKWITAHELFGIYKGCEFDSTALRGGTVATFIIDADGNVTGTVNGAITDFDSATGTFKIGDRYAYYDSVSKTIVTNYSSTASSTNLVTDLYVVTRVGDSSVAMTSAYHSQNTEWYVVWNSNKTKLAKLNIAGEDKFFFVDNDKVYGNVAVDVNGNSISDLSTVKTAGNILTITQNGTQVFKGVCDGTTFVGQDGMQGPYTGTGVLASIEVDGYGQVTIGNDTVNYTLNGNVITFVLNNRMMLVELNKDANTCAQVQDGYQETYTLPTTGTITLDGLGGAGDGATYVVDGTNITIYTAEGNTTYGLDVANKKLLGKSVFAGRTFSGTYKDRSDSSSHTIRVVFEDSSAHKGVIYVDYGTTYYFNFTAELVGNKLTMTIGQNIAGTSGNGKVVEATIEGSTMTFTKCGINSNIYSFDYEGSATCEGFSL